MPGATDALSGAGGALGSVFGYFLSQGDRDKAQQNLQQATDVYGDLNSTINAQQATDAFGNVSQGGRNAQLQALQQLQRVYQAGGMDPQAKADMFAATQQADNNAQAMNKQVQNQMAQRGLASSGANFAAQRANAQNAGNQAQMQGLQSLAQGYQRQMGALGQYGGLAGQLQGQDYQRAAAQNAISQFNAGQRQNAAEDTFGNSYQRATGLSQGYNNQAQNYNAQAKQMEQMAQGIGSAAGAAGGMALGGM